MTQFAILGIGHFGYYLGTQLYEKGHEVIAIDINKLLVQKIKDNVSQSIIGDTTNKELLESLGIQSVDTAIVCIGNKMQASILTTLYLKDLGVNNIFAKAINEDHGRILNKIGATDIFFPERDLAIKIARKLDNPNMIEYLPFMAGYSIVEFISPDNLTGKTLKELNLINRFGVQVLAVMQSVSQKISFIPTGDYQLKRNDTLIVLGPDDSLRKLRKL